MTNLGADEIDKIEVVFTKLRLFDTRLYMGKFSNYSLFESYLSNMDDE